MDMTQSCGWDKWQNRSILVDHIHAGPLENETTGYPNLAGLVFLLQNAQARCPRLFLIMHPILHPA